MTTALASRGSTASPQIPAPNQTGRSTGPTVKRAELATGVSLPYAECGDPAGVPVVMLHGVTDSWHSFEPVLAHLPASIRALALTQRGHGDADRPAGRYRTRDFAADVAAFVDSLGLGPVIVVGHSMGTANALRFAIDHPERVRGLVLAGGFASYRNNAVIVDYWESCVSKLTDPIAPAVAREFQESTLARPIAPEFLELVILESLKAPAHVWREAFSGMLEDDFTAELGRIRVPTLCVWGDRDAFPQRRDQEQFLASIPRARLTVYEGAGHALHWEEPARFATDLAAFAAEIAGHDSA